LRDEGACGIDDTTGDGITRSGGGADPGWSQTEGDSNSEREKQTDHDASCRCDLAPNESAGVPLSGMRRRSMNDRRVARSPDLRIVALASRLPAP
jgi:hypothetical protein